MKTKRSATIIKACGVGGGDKKTEREGCGYVTICLKLNNHEGLLYLNYNVNGENQWLIICVGGDNDLEVILH